MITPAAGSAPRRRNPLLDPEAVAPQPGADGTDVVPRSDAGVTPAARPSGRTLGRRIDPTGKHALFSTPPVAAPDQLKAGSRSSGRDAFYSTGARQVGTVVVQCATCTTRSRVTLLDLGVRFLSISAWIPGKRNSHWMRCPACHQHTWCHVGWTD